MIKKLILILLLFITYVSLTADRAMALSPERLQDMLERGEKVTIVDVRNTGLYTQGHIQGAINIPSSVIAMKRLPAVGYVVVCGDGIRTDLTLEAVNELNSKEGIKAEILEGGIAGWEALNNPTTHHPGIDKNRFKYLAYADFEKALNHNPDIVLIDLREGVPSEKQEEEPVLTNLSEKYPGVDIVKPRGKKGKKGKNRDVYLESITGGKGPPHRNQYVIVDDGDGRAEKVAQRLFAAGIKRVAILIGGEQSIQRDGKAGFKKMRK